MIEKKLQEAKKLLAEVVGELHSRGCESRKLNRAKQFMAWIDSNELSLSFCQRNLVSVKKYALDSQHKAVTLIEYRTMREGIEDASFFICPKEQVSCEFEAFITLCNHHLHHYQEWSIANMTPTNVPEFVDQWLLPELQEYDFTPLSENQIQDEVSWITEEIIKTIMNERFASERLEYPSQWGIFVNRQLVADSESYVLPISERFLSGLALTLQWNDKLMFYETDKEYVLFSWATGA
ncbi:hypothetical protein MD588_23250 [Photobacterium sp. SDRW27]|uniref:hypothetical protein n=1 Tax=Photobacterium obscurum TaxID=2829490 RepID=UPI002244E074|nr:hypothetical protein [Photobacterium obscurum]MCW8331721.1 hypothetical protein [Photobacterium obscurum]